MKKLFVVRHAKSSWDYPELDDHDRPLNNRGKNDAPTMGQRLALQPVKIDLMVSSTAKRAYDTATEIAGKVNYQIKHIRKEPLLFHASSSRILSVIQKSPDDVQSLMIFGHNPGLTDFVNELADTRIDNIPTCGIAEIDIEINSWQKIGWGDGALVSFDFPKKAL